MADIVINCASDLEKKADPCIGIKEGFPVMIAIMKPSGTLAVAGDTPTLAELQVGIADTGANKVILIERMTNGQRTEADRTTETGADTEDGLENVITQRMQITGMVKKFDAATRANLETLSNYQRLKVWFITDKGYIFGGKNGYLVSNFIGKMLIPGYGTSNHYPIKMVYVANELATDPAGQNDGFLDLVNVGTT